jgi:hypothetical protein
VLLFDPQSWNLDPHSWKQWHRRWFWPCLVIALLGAGWYAVAAVQAGTLPGGSSLPGLAAGAAAGVLFFYLFAFALRKLPVLSLYFRRRPTKFWLAQHIWLGLLTFPLVFYHSGLFTRWGGPLTVVLMVVYFLVFASGVWGLWVQQRVPRHLLQEIPDETIRSQIPQLTGELRAEAELLVLATCGPPGDDPTQALAVLQQTIPRIRATRSGKGAGLLRVLPAEPVPDTEPLRHYYRDIIDPYLQTEATSRSRLRLRARLKSDFNDLRLRINPDAHPVVDALEHLCERRRQFDEQAQLHGRLHSWILTHLSMSAALLVLLVWHAVTAVLYW